jgi:molybdopterin synthase sulfur carrier subunit
MPLSTPRDDPGYAAASLIAGDGPAAAPGAGGEPASVDLLLFAAARQAAGTARARLQARTVDEALDQARARFGDGFVAVLDRSRVWLNGEPASGPEPLAEGDEVAVLPPVSGG